MGTVFYLTLSFIFLSAFIGIYARRRMRDRCLKDFEGYRVTVELGDGKLVWGRMAVFSNGVELFYEEPHMDDGHAETSFVLFEGDLNTVQAIYRYHDELGAEHQQTRRAEIDSTYHPGLYRRTARSARNTLNSFRDAFNRSLGVALATAKKTGTNSVVATSDKELSSIGDTVLGTVAHAFEPILERYIGRRVVVEETRDDQIIEHPGILKEYTEKWIELLDGRADKEHVFPLGDAERLRINRNLDFDIDVAGDRVNLTVTYKGQRTVHLRRIEGLPEPLSIDCQLNPGDSETVVIPTAELDGLDFVVASMREVDRCLPRKHAILRHGGEPLETWYERLRRKRVNEEGP